MPVNEKISQQRRDLWKAESQFAVLKGRPQRRSYLSRKNPAGA